MEEIYNELQNELVVQGVSASAEQIKEMADYLLAVKNLQDQSSQYSGYANEQIFSMLDEVANQAIYENNGYYGFSLKGMFQNINLKNIGTTLKTWGSKAKGIITKVGGLIGLAPKVAEKSVDVAKKVANNSPVSDLGSNVRPANYTINSADNNSGGQQAAPTFFQKYKAFVIIGGVVLLAAIGLFIYKEKSNY